MKHIVSTHVKKDGVLRDAAFEAYKVTRNVEEAYKIYLQDNPAAQTTIKAFIRWASDDNWISRLNDMDVEDELQITQATRRAGLSNSLSAEELAAELMQTAKEEMELKRCDMNHRDIARYMTIATKICERWCPNPEPQLSVVVNNDVNQSIVDVPEDVLKRLGKEIVEVDALND